MSLPRIAVTVVVVLAIAAGTYFFFSGKEYRFRFTEDQLQEKLAKKLPFTKTYLLFFEVTLDNPRITLTEGSSRVQAGLDLGLNIQIGGQPKPLGGAVDASGIPSYVPEAGAFYLTDPVIENLGVQGIPAKYATKVKNVLTKALAAYYAEHPILTLKETSVKQSAVQLVLKSVVVENGKLVITLGL
ncbi:DUF1439 domain-containing protein [Pelagibius sp. Alg239-R121]|uniref:DUF1439 domain-containing protein n=1 Tax=Pelagibius sp. Alg239-R121 TaxID=2993448 RepID=UPI0024A74A6B|nr:DUF1439 domain-containing protein [Pelagibius sp. Alg239-R121]